LPLREYPHAASSQLLPVIHVLDKSNNVIFDGLACGPRYLAESLRPIASWWSTNQSIAV
jgi:hypothetical protein